MNVGHAGLESGNVGQGGQAAVDVSNLLLSRWPVVLQHVLDQVDPAARAVELVAEQNVGRTGRGAEAAMHAGAQDLVGDLDVGVGALCQGEVGLHGRAYTPAVIRPGFSTPSGSKLALMRADSAATPGTGGWNTGTAARTASSARIRVA